MIILVDRRKIIGCGGTYCALLGHLEKQETWLASSPNGLRRRTRICLKFITSLVGGVIAAGGAKGGVPMQCQVVGTTDAFDGSDI